MPEEVNRIIGKVFLAIVLFVVIAGGISLIANDQADGFGTVFLIIIMVIAVFGIGRAIIER